MCAHNYDGDVLTDEIAQVWSRLVSSHLVSSRLVSSRLVSSGLVWSGLVWSGLVWSGLVWSGLVWSGLVWSGLVWSGLSAVIGLCAERNGNQCQPTQLTPDRISQRRTERL